MDSPTLLRPRVVEKLAEQQSAIVDGVENRPVKLFCYHLDDDSDICLHEAKRYLSVEERQRGRAFISERDRERYIRGRGCLRRILALQLNREPNDLQLSVGEHGRPYLAGSGLSFNVSHSGGLAICALSRTHSVGIDLEVHQKALCFGPLLSLVFTETERARLKEKSGVERQRMFFDFWTAKEALMKLTGLGLSLAPANIELLLAGDHPCGFVQPVIENITLQHIDCAPFGHTPLSCHLVSAPRLRGDRSEITA
ncbi:hypothetical protein AWR36_010670 [Microbulbifer flavimaris]|uniref:4'-phosphopantetheinyl transferase n=1 Tax=Microbulbifer flavimaris TaxID=1781068 RepID=A0ABX4HYG6_9GAMM|nr:MULTISPECIES: 4'-phosphopantetheinyl transferase superfamily protein [Microbulbifer]KUJ82996.1 hypothetical protein AVO43_10650 [Microbulbifer sp. ZGT114]PCO05180.1 hypothetical protein AWR36_010670 [Microbulbifer flavimaris]